MHLNIGYVLIARQLKSNQYSGQVWLDIPTCLTIKTLESVN